MQEAPQPLVPLVKGDSPVRGNVRNADKGVAVSGEENVTAYAVTGGFRLKNPSVTRCARDTFSHKRRLIVVEFMSNRED